MASLDNFDGEREPGSDVPAVLALLCLVGWAVLVYVIAATIAGWPT